MVGCANVLSLELLQPPHLRRDLVVEAAGLRRLRLAADGDVRLALCRIRRARLVLEVGIATERFRSEDIGAQMPA